MIVTEPLRAADFEAAVDVLTEAFRDNPATHCILHGYDAAQREKIIRRAFAGFVRAYRRYCIAEVVRQEGRLIAVSLMAPPGLYPLSPMAELLVASGCVASGPRVAYRYAVMSAQLERRHPRDPHWYLFFLGVLPELQGRGIGSAVLKHLSAKAQTDRVPCYLETDKESSVRLYQRHGYEIVESKVHAEFQDLRMWYMRRPVLEV